MRLYTAAQQAIFERFDRIEALRVELVEDRRHMAAEFDQVERLQLAANASDITKILQLWTV
jgi:hypothetical protein